MSHSQRAAWVFVYALAATLCGAVVAAADEEETPLPICSSTAIEDAHRSAAGAIVDVRAPGVHGLPAAGIGFVFGTRRHVATAFSIVELGRGIEVVVGPDRYDAVVVTYSRGADLAILRLERPLSAPPLVAARRRLPVGEPVLAMGRSGWDDDAATVVAPGVVTGCNDRGFRSDALDGATMTWGGPTLDCAGDVVGVATTWHDDRLTAAAALLDLLDTIDDTAEPYRGGWSLLHPSVSLLGHFGHQSAPGHDHPDRWLGVGLGTALIGNDRWFFPIEGRAAWLVESESVTPLTRRNGGRLQLASAMGYRFLLASGDTPTYLIPTVGAVLSYESIRTERSSLALQPGCHSQSPCPVSVQPGPDGVASTLRLMPTAGLRLQLGFGTFGYEVQLDVEALDRSVHQLTMGFQF